MSIINCTPHTIKVFETEFSEELNTTMHNEIAEFPPSGFIMRLESEEQTPCGTIEANGTFGNPSKVKIPMVNAQKFKKDLKWPTAEDDPRFGDKNVTILVSMPVGQMISELHAEIPFNVAGPDTGPGGVIRDHNGQIKGTTRLVKYRDQKLTNSRK